VELGVFSLKPVTVLITCAGGVISPSQIDSLRNNPENRPLRIIGTDSTVPCVGQHLADRFFQVPFGTSPDYVDRMLKICGDEAVDVVFPASHEEALALTKKVGAFKKIGTVVAASRFEVLELAFNKVSSYRWLKDSGLPCPEFRAARNLAEFEAAAEDLGIDGREVVMKPVLTRGGRGARVLTKKSLARTLVDEKPGYLQENYDEVRQMLGELDRTEFPELVLMEYLPGTIYSVDFLARKGKALLVVPKVRVVGNASQTIVGVVKRDPAVEELTAKISEAFGFDYTVNIEMGSRFDGTVLPFDLNPRLAASVAFCSAAGANILYFALKMALGEEVPKVVVRDKVLMLRYFKELYIDS
jgi:carbamoyl-phosphate synthase large subunit